MPRKSKPSSPFTALPGPPPGGAIFILSEDVTHLCKETHLPGIDAVIWICYNRGQF